MGRFPGADTEVAGSGWSGREAPDGFPDRTRSGQLVAPMLSRKEPPTPGRGFSHDSKVENGQPALCARS